MSIFSDYKVGALTDWEFEQEGRRMNREDRWDREHMYDDLVIDTEGEEDGYTGDSRSDNIQRP